MQKIYKYTLPITGRNTVLLPVNAQVVSFDIQNNMFHMWALVTPGSNAVNREFVIIRTGFDEVKDIYRYIATCHIREVREVWHLFEIPLGVT